MKAVLKSLYHRVFGPAPRASQLNYAHDGLFTTHNADFMTDPRFQEAYAAGKATGSWGDADLEWRVHVCLWIAAQSVTLEGDFVECGTNRGGTAMSMLTFLADADGFGTKRFVCFDTFEGLAAGLSSDAELSHYQGKYEDCFDEVAHRFAPFDQVRLVRGSIPETLHEFDGDRVAFLHIDMNSAIPERAAIDFFWPRLSAGAFVLLDDFGWEASHEQRSTFVDFAAAHDVPILWLPTGQGLLRKP